MRNIAGYINTHTHTHTHTYTHTETFFKNRFFSFLGSQNVPKNFICQKIKNQNFSYHNGSSMRNQKCMYLRNTASGLCIETINLFISKALVFTPKISLKIYQSMLLKFFLPYTTKIIADEVLINYN